MSSGTSAASGASIRQEWWVVDATNKVLGRLATRVARVLCGKHRPQYLPYLDSGDFVVVTNADKILLTGSKSEDKIYHRHTGYPGGLKSVRAKGPLGEVSREAHRSGSSRHASQVEARTQAVEEVEGLSRAVAPARGAEAPSPDAPDATRGELSGGRANEEELWRLISNTGPPGGARARWRVSDAPGLRLHHGQQTLPRRLLPRRRQLPRAARRPAGSGARAARPPVPAARLPPRLGVGTRLC